MNIRIEDDFEDVLSKAMRGLGLKIEDLVVLSGLSESAIESLLSGIFNEVDLNAIAPHLGLDSEKLARMALKDWRPEGLSCEGLRCFNTPFPVPGYEEMTVNNFIVWDADSKEACIFDTGADPESLLAFIEKNQLRIRALFLTHTHRDHVCAYKQLMESLEIEVVYSPELEPFGASKAIAHQAVVEVGALTIEARLTNGHSPGGMTYVVSGLPQPVAIVGDSTFCLSMGKAHSAYSLALKNNREQILSLPPSTILCPGHGPLTSVAIECARNPFF